MIKCLIHKDSKIFICEITKENYQYNSDLYEIIETNSIPNFIKSKWNETMFIESANLEEIKNIKNEKIYLLKTKQYEELSKTDWYFTRFLENKTEIPIEILKERQEIRIKYDNLINEINNE